MQHGIVRNVIGSASVVQITPTEYEQLKAARNALLDLLFAEEKFDLVIQNYLELETELLGSTAQEILSNATDYQWFQIERNLLNRRLLNLLSSSRGYIDHIRHAVHALFGRDSIEAQHCVKQFAEHYDSCLGYRVMEALRNYTQHRGFPIHALEFSSTLHESEQRNRFKFGIAIYTKTSYLGEGNIFKKSVLKELEALGGRVDVKPMVRDYIAALATIHDLLRDGIGEKLKLWEEQICSAIERFKTAYPDEPSLIGLAAMVIDGPTRTGEVNLFSEFIEYRRHLAKKNSGLKRLGVFYVSGESLSKDT